jgi:hypothetical protein
MPEGQGIVEDSGWSEDFHVILELLCYIELGRPSRDQNIRQDVYKYKLELPKAR